MMPHDEAAFYSMSVTKRTVSSSDRSHISTLVLQKLHTVVTLPLGCTGGPGELREGGPLETCQLARDEPKPDMGKSPSISALDAPRGGAGQALGGQSPACHKG